MNWTTPTTYMQRLGHALELLCAGKRPPDEMIVAWFDAEKEDNRLQEFACEHGPIWSQGIVLIDAARVLADSPGEGVDHELLAEPNSLCRHGVRPPHECKECEAEATPDEIAAFMAAEGLAPNKEVAGLAPAQENDKFEAG